jgi:transcriptional regulator with XRE-family HTH domain
MTVNSHSPTLANAAHRHRFSPLQPESVKRELVRAIIAADKSVTQEEIADRFQVTQSYVSRVTREARRLMDLMERLHVTVGEVEAELDFEIWHKLTTILEVEALLRRRGFTRAGLSAEALAETVDLYRRAK